VIFSPQSRDWGLFACAPREAPTDPTRKPLQSRSFGAVKDQVLKELKDSKGKVQAEGSRRADANHTPSYGRSSK